MKTWLIELGEDLPAWAIALACVLFVVALGATMLQARRATRYRAWVILSGLAAYLLLTLAVLRPAMVRGRSVSVGAKVALLVDRSRRLDLPGGARTRAELAEQAVAELRRHYQGARISRVDFGAGAGESTTGGKNQSVPDAARLDLMTTLADLPSTLGERPNTIVVVSDGRWERPAAQGTDQDFELLEALRGSVLNTVSVGGEPIADATILSVHTSGTAVAHQPFSLRVEVGCLGGLRCDTMGIVARELRQGVAPAVLAHAEVRFADGPTAYADLEMTLERAGTRVVEIAIDTEKGDRILENNTRIVVFDVSRDRIRLLHVAGRPTYDVRELRRWLKNDASVDLVSFFILRTDADDTKTQNDAELALIPFPVDELFTEHLPSFDAIVIEDIDAKRYRLDAHLENIARYVEQGGGLLLVGGPSAFAGGAYAGTPLERVLPVHLVASGRPFDTVEFVPRVTDAGRGAALLEPLRRLVGDELPSMPGSNSFGPARPDAVVLWEHPDRRALPYRASGTPGPMPVLAVSEVRDGRVVVLGLDGTYRLVWSSLGSSTAGRAYGALWEGLLGWVMRDPRFESLRGELLGECISDRPTTLRWSLPAGASGNLKIQVSRLGDPKPVPRRIEVPVGKKSVLELSVGTLEPGGYSARAQIGTAPLSRLDFGCEKKGRAWADSRPDPARLRRLARINGGTAVGLESISKLPAAAATQVHVTRHVTSLLANWIWSLAAALALGAHWILRRLSGLS